MKFKAGDKVWARGDNAKWGTVGTFPAIVLGPSKNQSLSARVKAHRCGGTCMLYDIEIDGKLAPTGKTFVNIECQMWPRDEDGRQVGTWEHSATVWRPGKDLVIKIPMRLREIKVNVEVSP